MCPRTFPTSDARSPVWLAPCGRAAACPVAVAAGRAHLDAVVAAPAAGSTPARHQRTLPLRDRRLAQEIHRDGSTCRAAPPEFRTRWAPDFRHAPVAYVRWR